VIYAHITAAGEAKGITAERLNRMIERHERNAAQTITLPPSQWRRMDEPSPAPSWVIEPHVIDAVIGGAS